MKRYSRLLSLLLACTIIFCSLPFNAHADDVFEVPSPIIEISTNKAKYRAFDVAEVKVKIYASAEIPIENVNIETTLDKQLSCTSASSLSKETTLLTDEPIEYSFGVVVSKNATGLNFFQRVIAFLKSIFIKTFSVKGKSYNDGRKNASKTYKITLGSVSGAVVIDVWYQGSIQNTDTDGDGLIDYFERVNGLNPNLADTDSDGLNDFDEFVTVGTDPTKEDTDGNGINDFDDDNDQDELSNGYELSIGTSANASDTDCDGLNDKDEKDTYHTNPIAEDTDEDGASDGWEVENGFNPTKKESSFHVTVACENSDLIASATVNTTGATAESVSIVPVKNSPIINETIPGYLGSAFEFSADGNLGIANITFTFDEKLQNDPDFNPTIYCLNEESQNWYEYETIITGNKATAQSTHFSTYILINRNVYERYLKEQCNIDYALDTGIDSNNDGISDYVTKLMCDGIIRSGTGTKVFGDYTFEQIQANDDIDADGIKNGDEITVNYQLDIPDDATEFNGHYYKRFDVGYVWDDAEAYCESIGGYLATITSANEQAHIESMLSGGSRNSYWLGARKKNGSFHWLTNETFGYTKWAWNQPDNNGSSGFEDCLMVYNARNPRSSSKVGEWNDLNNHAICGNEPFFGINNFGFICEWEAYSVGTQSFTFVNSSPILNDSDKDGFVDLLDPTPIQANVFANFDLYKKYYYDNTTTVTFFARQPIWDSRICYDFDAIAPTHPYTVATGQSGHSFLGIDYADGRKNYYGFGGETSSYAYTALSRQATFSTIYEESRSPWTIGKTFIINDMTADFAYSVAQLAYATPYQITSNNCTTFAVNQLKLMGISPKIYEHFFKTSGTIKNILAHTYYGYSPADACQDIRDNYSFYIASRSYTLNDGTICYNAVEVFSESGSGGGHSF